MNSSELKAMGDPEDDEDEEEEKKSSDEDEDDEDDDEEEEEETWRVSGELRGDERAVTSCAGSTVKRRT